MTPQPSFITNHAATSKKLMAADNNYARAREAARLLPLAEKLLAQRKAVKELHEAYKQAGIK